MLRCANICIADVYGIRSFISGVAEASGSDDILHLYLHASAACIADAYRIRSFAGSVAEASGGDDVLHLYKCSL